MLEMSTLVRVSVYWSRSAALWLYMIERFETKNRYLSQLEANEGVSIISWAPAAPGLPTPDVAASPVVATPFGAASPVVATPFGAASLVVATPFGVATPVIE
jgi:hypothetical protein